MVQFSNHLLDNFIAPKLSILSSCGASDIPEFEDHFVAFALNQALGGNYPEHLSVTLLNFLRRLSFSVRQYRAGQQQLKKYVEGLPQAQAISAYSQSLLLFESCVLSLYTSILCLQNVSRLLRLPTRMFQHGDGSDYDRLRMLNNRIKHYDENIEEAFRARSSIQVTPVWITDVGLESSCGTRLAFSEMVQMIGDANKDAKAFTFDIIKEAADRRKNN